jgi:serine/threonine protein kinase
LPGNKVKKLVSLTPARLGQLALEVRINYTDIWNVPQSKTAVTWITVFKPGGQMPSIPGYKLLWRLSASDAAVIYVGQKISDNLRLIIKTPQFSLEQNSLISEYMSELKQASRLVHPNIITIQAFGEQPVPWVALEYMSKGTLARRIGQISIEEALRIAISITDALYYGRMNRLAHRWVTPDNIFFNEQDVPKLANWRVGQITQKLYKNAGSAELMTAYYPPEKLLNSGGLDFFSDIYQLAAVLYEMLTGKPVFTEKGDELVDKIRHGHPHAASYYNPEINKPLDDLLQSCLAKNKKDRPQSTNGLKIELQKILSAYKKQPQKK